MTLSVHTAELSATTHTIHADYAAVTTQWNDGQRGFDNDGNLSCWGNNITDTRLMFGAKQLAPCVRPNNMNEKLGVVRADKVFVVVHGKRLSVHDLLCDPVKYASYIGMTRIDAKVDPSQPEYVVVRFQEAFVPLEAGQARTQVVPHNFNYQTRRDDAPRNLLFCASAQGLYAHADAPGSNPLYAHTVSEACVTQHRFDVEETGFAVGAAQCGDAPKPEEGGARAVEMGLEGMGPHSNCFMVLSIPSKQTRPPLVRGSEVEEMEEEEEDEFVAMPVYRSLASGSDGFGVARAARLSVSEDSVGIAKSRANVTIERPEKGAYKEPIVLTMLFYNTLRAQPGTQEVRVRRADAELAIAHMERLYSMCDRACKLSELPAMLHKLTSADMARIQATRAAFGADFAKATEPAKKDPFAPCADAIAQAMQA